VDSSGPKDAQVQSYSPGGANVPSWEDTLLSNSTEPTVYDGDAPYGKLLWPLVRHADLHSRIDSQALRAEYCIVGIPHNTAV